MTALRWLTFIATLPVFAQQFEVASIKVSNPPPDRRNSSSISNSEGGFRATNTSLNQLILYALDAQSYQLSGGPAWARDDRFDVTAKNDEVEQKDIPLQDTSRQEERIRKIRYRLRDLLETRFQLVLREEEKELSIYALTADKGGPKMKIAAEPRGNMNTNSSNGAASIKGEGVTMPRLCTILSSMLGRPVIDETGISGAFDIELKYSTDEAVAGKEKALEDITGPTIFTALRETLGLRLTGRKGPVKTWVIERVEKPGEN